MLSIHQPSYFPWLGLLNKIANTEKFVLLDDVQANKSEYQFRNIFYCNGEPKVLSLPVDYRLGKKLCDLRFKNSDWTYEHLDKIRNYYYKAPFFSEIYPLLESFYSDNKTLIPIGVMINSMKLLFKLFDINVEITLGSSLECVNHKGDLVLEICRKMGTDKYLSGRGALDYMDSEILKLFTNNSIEVYWHKFTHPVYEQYQNLPFVTGLSGIDLMFFKGIIDGRRIFKTTLDNVVYVR